LALELGRLDGAVGAELRQDVQKMTHLVEQLLLLAQVDAETAAPVALVPTDLADLAEELIGRMAPLAHRNDHLIAFERRGRVEAMGRPETIERALRNLIENALAVTPPSECVTVIAGPGPQIRVRDGGPGLSVDDLERLSRRFARADRSTGSGLGLAIVSTIMQHHGGSLATDPEAREIILRFPACSPG
jgi:signal transduction histidine kinase